MGKVELSMCVMLLKQMHEMEERVNMCCEFKRSIRDTSISEEN